MEAEELPSRLNQPTEIPTKTAKFHRPPGYVETEDPLGRLRAAAADQAFAVEVRDPGAWLDVG